jgi:hypothetical protein
MKPKYFRADPKFEPCKRCGGLQGVGMFTRDKRRLWDLCYLHRDDCPTKHWPEDVGTGKVIEEERCDDCPHAVCGRCSGEHGARKIVPRVD